MLQLLKNKKISICGLIFILIMGWFGLSNCFADDGYKGVMKVKEINPPPGINTPSSKQEGVSKPRYFATGTVDAVGDSWITINDHQFPIAPDAFLSCGVGDFVGIQINDERQVISCEMILQ